MLKNLETGRYGHLVDYKECCKAGLDGVQRTM